MTKTNKTAYLLRWGAYGDVIFITQVIRLIKQKGYHVIVEVNERGKQMLKKNPFVDEIVLHKEGSLNYEEQNKYWEALEQQYDFFINFSGTIEGKLLKCEGTEDFFLPKEERISAGSKNFFTLAIDLVNEKYNLGIGQNTKQEDLHGELFFNKVEKNWIRNFKKRHKNHFLILWSISGSSPHKSYPYMESTARLILDCLPNVKIIFCGDSLCQYLEFEHDRVINTSGRWSIRKSLIMAKYANMVISPETAMAAAGGCFDTPQIIFMSHTSAECFAKNYKNCTALTGSAKCSPCFRINYSMDYCMIDSVTRTPKCMSTIKVLDIFRAVEKEYAKWMKM